MITPERAEGGRTMGSRVMTRMHPASEGGGGGGGGGGWRDIDSNENEKILFYAGEGENGPGNMFVGIKTERS